MERAEFRMLTPTEVWSGMFPEEPRPLPPAVPEMVHSRLDQMAATLLLPQPSWPRARATLYPDDHLGVLHDARAPQAAQDEPADRTTGD